MSVPWESTWGTSLAILRHYPLHLWMWGQPGKRIQHLSQQTGKTSWAQTVPSIPLSQIQWSWKITTSPLNWTWNQTGRQRLPWNIDRKCLWKTDTHQSLSCQFKISQKQLYKLKILDYLHISPPPIGHGSHCLLLSSGVTGSMTDLVHACCLDYMC